MPTNALVLSRLLLLERPSLLRLIGRIVESTAVEDAAQTLWLRVQSVDDSVTIADERAYLYRLAINVAWDHGRTRARQRRVQEQAQDILWGRDGDPATDRVLIAREELARVLAAADDLPEPTRTIFYLNRIEGLPQREIAERLGVSRTTVEKHMRKAMARLGDARNGV